MKKKKFRPTSVGQFGNRTVVLDEHTLTTVVSEPGEPTHVIRPLPKDEAQTQAGRHFAYVASNVVIYGTVETVQGSHVHGPCYSVLCRDGKPSDTPIAAVQVWLSDSEFAYVQDYGWPSDAFAVSCVRGGVSP